MPDSSFATNADALTESTLTEVVSNLGGGEEPGAGLRGTTLVSVTAQPLDRQLSPGDNNTLTLSSDLSFAVLVRNSGDVQLTDVLVKFTLQQSGRTERKDETIDVLNPDQERIVSFGDFADLNIADPSALTITIVPVDEETNLDNNSEGYDIILSLS